MPTWGRFFLARAGLERHHGLPGIRLLRRPIPLRVVGAGECLNCCCCVVVAAAAAIAAVVQVSSSDSHTACAALLPRSTLPDRPWMRLPHPAPQSCVLCDSANITTAAPVVISCDGYLGGTADVSQATLS